MGGYNLLERVAMAPPSSDVEEGRASQRGDPYRPWARRTLPLTVRTRFWKAMPPVEIRIVHTEVKENLCRPAS